LFTAVSPRSVQVPTPICGISIPLFSLIIFYLVITLFLTHIKRRKFRIMLQKYEKNTRKTNNSYDLTKTEMNPAPVMIAIIQP
jgi:hypothetical protein